MTDLDLNTWTSDTSALVLVNLPLQSQNSAIIYTSTYLSNVGGWIPDDPSNPTGPGQPANGYTPAQAAVDIAAQQYSSVYDINFNVSVVLELQSMAKLSPGLTQEEATNALLNNITNFIVNAINDSALPLRLDSVTNSGSGSGTYSLGGLTNADERVAIANELYSPNKIIDYKATTLEFAMDQYGIDDTWNVYAVYTEVGDQFAIVIQKYTDDTYQTLDNTNTLIYVLTVSPITYVVSSGSAYNLS